MRARFHDELAALEAQALGGIDLAVGDDPDRREWAMHMVLVARALERFGDDAVDVGEQTAFVVTGLFRAFTDAAGVAA